MMLKYQELLVSLSGIFPCWMAAVIPAAIARQSSSPLRLLRIAVIVATVVILPIRLIREGWLDNSICSMTALDTRGADV